MGYSTYLTFALGLLNTLTVVYYLLIKNVPALLDIFPKFVTFSILSLSVGVPIAVLAGWLHLKGSTAMTAELDIMYEASPYNYKLPPGYYREAWTPAYLELLELTKKIAKGANLLTDEEDKKIQEIEKKLNILIQGGYVGTPRRRTWS